MPTRENGSTSITGGLNQFNFESDHVFGPNSSQEDVFAELNPLVQVVFLLSSLIVLFQSVLDGCNVSVLAYGQAGSGKTFTMKGDGNYRAQDLGKEELSGLSFAQLHLVQ